MIFQKTNKHSGMSSSLAVKHHTSRSMKQASSSKSNLLGVRQRGGSFVVSSSTPSTPSLSKLRVLDDNLNHKAAAATAAAATRTETTKSCSSSFSYDDHIDEVLSFHNGNSTSWTPSLKEGEEFKDASPSSFICGEYHRHQHNHHYGSYDIHGTIHNILSTSLLAGEGKDDHDHDGTSTVTSSFYCSSSSPTVVIAPARGSYYSEKICYDKEEEKVASPPAPLSSYFSTSSSLLDDLHLSAKESTTRTSTTSSSHFPESHTYCTIIDQKSNNHSNIATHVKKEHFKNKTTTPSSSNVNGVNGVNGNTPVAQKFRDDKQKKKRVKTELCSLYNGNPGSCPYGKNCNYAHNVAELEKKYLFERHEAGLIDDIQTYRVRPCFDFVSTGDCPMHLRCSCLHDQRTKGLVKSWLHRSVYCSQKILLDDDLSSSTSKGDYHHIDWHYYDKLSHDGHGHPFGTKFLPDDEEGSYNFQDFYNKVMNKVDDTATTTSDFEMSEYQLIQIVKRLRHSFAKSKAIQCYRHTHKMYDSQVCMLIQTKVFSISSDEVKEININHIDNSVKYMEGRNRVVVVHEVMFEPSEESCGEIVLLFNDGSNYSSTTNDIFQELTEKETRDIKKVKRKLQKNAFPTTLKMFHMCYPKDKDAHNLITEMLDHHLHYGTLHHHKETMSFCSLERKFSSLIKHFSLFYWPVNQGYGNIDWLSIVPKFDSEYHVPNKHNCNTSKMMEQVWKSFIVNCTNHTFPSKCTSSPCTEKSASTSHLSVFTILSQGNSYDTTNSKFSIPNIKNKVIPPGLSSTNITIFSEEQESYWKKVVEKCNEKKKNHAVKKVWNN